MRMRPTTKAALSVVAGLAALATLTACGGTSSADASTTAAAPAASTASGATQPGPPDLTAFRDCMAQNGVNLPDFGAPGGNPPSGQPTGMPTGAPPFGGANGPGGGMPLPDGVDQETFDAARAACADQAPTLGGPGGAGAPNIDASALAAFRSCLADNGVTVAEGTDPLRDLDRTDATVKAAMDTCAPLLPAPGSSSTG